MNKFKKNIPNLLLLILALSASLFLFEILAGRYVKANKIAEKLNYLRKGILNKGSRGIGAFDKDLGWGFNPGSQERRRSTDFDVKYSINSKGNRDKEIQEEKPPEIFRIIASGESMVFGDGINYGKRFSEVIENSLADVEVVNMGVWGYGADQSLLQLKRDGFRFHPDVVVLFAINDFFYRCKYMSRTGQAKPRFVLNPAKDGIILQDVESLKKELKESPFYNKYDKPAEGKGIQGKKKHQAAGSKLKLLLDYSSKLLGVDKPDKDSDKKHWNKVWKDLSYDQKYASAYSKEDFRKLIYFILKEYSSACQERGVDFILVHIDIGDELNLQDICRQLNITYLDLSQVLSHASEKKPFTFEIDPHYNNYTHRVIGEYLSDYLKKRYGLEKSIRYTYRYLGKF